MAAATLAAAPEVDAEPRFRRSRSRAGSVCAVDDAIGSIRIDDDEEEVGEFGRERSLGAGSDAATPVDADADDADDEGTRGKRASSSDNEGNNACFYFQRHTEAHKRPATVAEACLELDLLACDESAADVLASAPKQRRQPQNAAAAAVEEEEGGGGEEGEGAEQDAAAKTEEERSSSLPPRPSPSPSSSPLKETTAATPMTRTPPTATTTMTRALWRGRRGSASCWETSSTRRSAAGPGPTPVRWRSGMDRPP